MEIPLTNMDICAHVDECDYERVIGYSNWFMNTSNGYIVASRTKEMLHKFILNVPRTRELTVHHKDGNRLNNSRKNLARMSANMHASLHKKERQRKLILWAESVGMKGFADMNLPQLECLYRRMLPKIKGIRNRPF